MEIELKYIVEEPLVKERIFNDGHIKKLRDEQEPQVLEMRAIYMDTPDGALRKKEMAFRVRFEDDRMIATLKWGGKSENGLHIRGELNVPVDKSFLDSPSIDIFKGSEIFNEISCAVGTSSLKPVMEMAFQRKEIRIDTGKSISVISLDEGSIITDNGNVPISELEIELYSGDKDDMIALGEELCQKYNLKREDKSKFQRGLEMMGV